MIQIKNITITTILVIILMGDDDAAIDEKSLSTNDKEEQSLGKNENCFSSLAQWLTHPWNLHCSPEITDTELQLDTMRVLLNTAPGHNFTLKCKSAQLQKN